MCFCHSYWGVRGCLSQKTPLDLGGGCRWVCSIDCVCPGSDFNEGLWIIQTGGFRGVACFTTLHEIAFHTLKVAWTGNWEFKSRNHRRTRRLDRPFGTPCGYGGSTSCHRLTTLISPSFRQAQKRPLVGTRNLRWGGGGTKRQKVGNGHLEKEGSTPTFCCT